MPKATKRVKTESTPVRSHRRKLTAPAEPKPSSIGKKAMLVRLTVHRWTPSTVDRQATEEVARNHGSDLHMGRYQKELVDRKALAEINSITNEIRAAHWFWTLPWIDGGQRLLSSAGYFEYNKEILALRDKFDTAKNAFLDKYVDHIKDAKKRLGTLFIEGEYPTRQELENRYGIEVAVDPVPDHADFRVDLGNEETDRIKGDIMARAQSTLDKAMKDVWTRLHDVVAKASERLKAYTVTDSGVENGFRDSLITNIVELLDILPALNVTDSTELATFAATIRHSITSNNAQVLRDDSTLRKQVAAQADDILAKMQGYLA
jgi:hypothetical protein